MGAFGSRVSELIQKHPIGSRAAAGGVMGAGLGAMYPTGGHHTARRTEARAKQEGAEKGTPEYAEVEKKVRRSVRIGNTVALGATGAYFGAMHGARHQMHNGGYRPGGGGGFHNPNAAPSASTLRKHLGLSGDEKTKAEVKKKFRDLARKHHPDLNPGADPMKMKNLNRHMEDMEKTHWFQKLGFFWRGFEKSAHGRG